MTQGKDGKEVKSERHLKNQRKRMSYYCPQKQRGRESYLQEERELGRGRDGETAQGTKFFRLF